MKKMFKETRECRICGNTELISVLNLGVQALTGVFPKSRGQVITSGPLELLKCTGGHEKSCGLVQLGHSYDLEEMYGNNYGYRSGLNASMVRHLHSKVEKIQDMVELVSGDLIIDIGSNDCTLLKGYSKKNLSLVGIDPTGSKFKKYYPDHVQLIPDFFSSETVRKHLGNKKAKVITSIAMFYDLESPLDFMHQICDVLSDDGVWIFEQSYMPTMLARNAYDTICHEHLEYYSLKQIKWMTDRTDMKIVDVELNDINGGSFSVTAAKRSSSYTENTAIVDSMLKEEAELMLETLAPYDTFKRNVFNHKEELVKKLNRLKAEGKRVLGYGASTKGNVILQFCNISEPLIPYIAELNENKFGCFTPGTNIPIISEEAALTKSPDYFLVLPWHFKENLAIWKTEFLRNGGKMLFPLPHISIVEAPQNSI